MLTRSAGERYSRGGRPKEGGSFATMPRAIDKRTVDCGKNVNRLVIADIDKELDVLDRIDGQLVIPAQGCASGGAHFGAFGERAPEAERVEIRPRRLVTNVEGLS